MAKNKKNQSAAVRFGPALKAFLLCALIGGSGVGYVWQKSKLDDLGREIKKREQAVAQLLEQNRKLRDNLAVLRSPPSLERRIEELKFGLGRPLPTQIWVLPEPSAAPSVMPRPALTGEAARQLAAQ